MSEPAQRSSRSVSSLIHMAKTSLKFGIFFIGAVCSVAMLLLLYAAPSTAAADEGYLTTALIGQQVEGTRYPYEWSYQGGTGFKDGEMVAFLKRRGKYAIVLERYAERPIPGKPTKRLVLDVLAVRVNPQDGFRFSESCTAPGQRAPIYAEVKFKKCERFSERVSRAWMIDFQRSTFVSIPKSNVRCESPEWDQGAEKPNCPSGIDRSTEKR